MIPMSTLRLSPFSLVQGAVIVAKLKATNAVGSSPFSDHAVLGGQSYADVRTVPAKPPTAPTRGAGTTTTTLEVAVAALAGADTGGEPILSYEIDYDGATAGATWTPL